MFNACRQKQFSSYLAARNYFIKNYDQVIRLEKYFATYLYNTLKKYLSEIKFDYNETNYLYPFWQNYPPDDRGRQPKGDQYPWIEVAEHVFGAKIARYIGNSFKVRDIGLPTGADQRFVIANKDIYDMTHGYTDNCWLFIDFKSVGPRDDQDHTVMSHNQISGCGRWDKPESGVSNNVMTANGKRVSHKFHCSLPPIYILSDGTIAPVILAVVKPVYGMLNLEKTLGDVGQPLRRITIIAIPNGLLLEENPNYLRTHPELLFPGKDDKGKNPRKVRCRISFPILRNIADWRVKDIQV